MIPDNDDNNNLPLKSLLREWTVPDAPVSLEGRLDHVRGSRGGRTPWWRNWLTSSVPVPVPVALGLLLLLAYGTWRTTTMKPAPCGVAIHDSNCGSAGISC
jgi:hypothetical protein